MATKIQPLGDRIVLKRIEEKEQIRGGIIIPDAAKEKSQEAEVVAVGEGRTLQSGEIAPPRVKPGDRVLLGKYSGTEIGLDGETVLVCREDEILGIVVHEPAAATA